MVTIQNIDTLQTQQIGDNDPIPEGWVPVYGVTVIAHDYTFIVIALIILGVILWTSRKSG